MSAILITVGIVVLAVCAIASVPHLINYQGVLTDSGGVPISGSHDLTFTIYPDSTLSAPVYWTETHVGVEFDDGLFHVILGGTTAIPDGLFAEEMRWIGITVDATPEMKPRQQVTSVPWALHAAVADTVLSGGGGSGDGHSLDAADGDPADVVYVDNDGHVGIGTTSPIAPLHVASGSTVLMGADTLGYGSKLMWLPSKSAFRVGFEDGSQWDWANIGDYSNAMGYRTKASGDYSTAIGRVTNATGDYSTAMGGYATASGNLSTAMGYFATASGIVSTAMGDFTKAESYISMAVGRYNVGGGTPDAWILTDPLFEIGNGTGANPANAMTVLKNGNVGIGTPAPAYELDVSGTVQMESIKMSPGSYSGYVLTSDATGIGSWAPQSGGSSWDQTGSDIYYDAGKVGIGTPIPIAPLHVASGSTVLFGADTLAAGSKFMWIPSKSAFRAGSILDTRWDWANIGDGSIAMGLNTMASGDGSTAIGYSTAVSGTGSAAIGYNTSASGSWGAIALGNATSASGDASTALGILSYASGYVSTAMGGYTSASGQSSTSMGWETTASGNSSIAMGNYTTASGYTSTAMGDYTKAESYSSMAIGRYNVGGGSKNSWVATDPLFEIGCGSVSGRMNAMTVLKSGRVGISTSSPEYRLQVGNSGDGSQARANAWNLLSSREYKKDIESFTPSEYQEVLASVKSTEVVRYRFVNDEKNVQHIGVIAEDSPREILSSDGKAVSLGDYCAFLLAAIKAQQEQIDELKGEIEQLKLKD